MVRVGVIGCGYWGPNLIRNFSTCPTTSWPSRPGRPARVACEAGGRKGFAAAAIKGASE